MLDVSDSRLRLLKMSSELAYDVVVSGRTCSLRVTVVSKRVTVLRAARRRRLRRLRGGGDSCTYTRGARCTGSGIFLLFWLGIGTSSTGISGANR